MEWITKKVVAALVNKWFGSFLEEVNTQEVNDALLAGHLNLTNLKVRKDALSFLNGIFETALPIEIQQGIIGRISLTVPYSSIFSQPLVVTIQDVLLLVAPVLDYDPAGERDRQRNFKNWFLRELFPEKVAKDMDNGHAGLLGLLYNRVWNNLQLKINDVHIRYEDTYSCPAPLVIGVCLQSLSAETTNHKWKKVPVESSSQTVSKVVEITSLSVYVNPEADNRRLVRQHILTDRWREYLTQGLGSFSINEEQFQFVLSPVRCKVKIRQHITKEARVPGLLVDALIRENVNITLEQKQYLALLQLAESFANITLNRKFMKHRPEVPLKRHSAMWWQYAYKSVVSQFIRPFSWNHIKSYRKLYREYVQMYKRYLVEKRDCELEADLLKHEDSLNLESIVAGRMEAKIVLSKEEPELLKPAVIATCGWFSWFFGGSNKDKESQADQKVDLIAARRTNQILATMSPEERNILLKELSSLNHETEKRHKEDIDQKIYLSVKELTITLKDEERKDVGLCLMTGYVVSFENRFGVHYKKYSIKVETLSVEAANMEDDLVHVLKLVEGTSSVGYGVALACDFEIKPLSRNEDYGLTVKLDPVEISYHQEAFLRLMKYFIIPEFRFFENKFNKQCQSFVASGRRIVDSAKQRKTLISLDIDIKSPYIICPEYGTIQKGGNVLIVDLGGLKMFTEFGGCVKNLEEATKMELEERLYDRLTIVVSHFQVLFADSGDEWRVMRIRDDSDLHLLPRVRVKIGLASNLYPYIREHPKHKVDVHFTPVKLNLSDNRIIHLIEFHQHFPTLKEPCDNLTSREFSVFLQDPRLTLKSASLAELSGAQDFLYIKLKPDAYSSHTANTEASTPELLRHVKPIGSLDTISQTSLEVAKYFPEESDEEEDNLNKPVDLIGFEDNTSPSNMIQVLSRFCVDEIIISISRSSDHGERPYLMIKVSRFLIECAVMDYGPALQLTVGSLHLVDKYHHSATGEYLELVSSSNKGSILTLLYRKVRADCPDFKSNFHSCEQSFVLDISSVSFVWHRSAVLSLTNFVIHLPSQLMDFYTYSSSVIQNSLQDLKQTYFSTLDDPPVPHGATKWSTNVTVSKLAFKMCDNEADFLYLKLSGLQCGCVFKANEKITFRASLADILVEDLSDITLYSRVVEVEEDRVFDVKIVKFSPVVCDISESNDADKACKPDASISMQVGRLQCVLLYKLLADVVRFFDSTPFNNYCQNVTRTTAELVASNFVNMIKKCKVTQSLSIHTPTLLIPQKSDSPCLLVCNLGDFKVDNFFKTVPGNAANNGVLENVLLEFGPVEICRAVMTLGGGLELQEAILEPAKIRVDLKRSLMRQCRDVLSWDMAVNIDSLYINLGQRDLNTVLGVLTQNQSEAHFPDSQSHSRPLTPDNEGSAVADDNVGKLQAFLTHSVDIYRIAFASAYLESIRVTLYTDMNEVLSSPVRDAVTALCRCEIGEMEMLGDMYNDRSLDLRATLKSCDVYDVRADSGNFMKKLFGQLLTDVPIVHGGFKFNVPPLLDLTAKFSPNGDVNTEISLDRVRLNISVGFGLAIYNYISIAVPGSANSTGGILNPGFTEDIGAAAGESFIPMLQKAPSSSDSTSGYLSTVTSCSQDPRVISVSFKSKLPEVVLFVDPEESDSRVVVLRCYIQCDYSKHPGNESFKINLDKVVIFTSTYVEESQNSYVIVSPFYLEGTWSNKYQEDGEKLTVKVSDVCATVCPPVVHILSGIIEELSECLAPQDTINLELPTADTEDLWSPKPLTATIIPSDAHENYISSSMRVRVIKQQMKLIIPSLKISFETCASNSTTPVFALTISAEVEINDWSKALCGRATLTITFLHFNDELSSWEYILDPVSENSRKRPLELNIRLIQHIGKQIGVKSDQRNKNDDSFDTWSHSDRCSQKDNIADDSKSSSDEEDNKNSEMVILKPSATRMKRGGLRRSGTDIPTISGYSLDSDSETEGNLLYNITSTFSHMLSSDSEISEGEEGLDTGDDEGREMESETEAKDFDGDVENRQRGETGEPLISSDAETDKNRMFAEDSHNIMVDNTGLAYETSNLGTSLIIISKDSLEFTLTPKMISAAHSLFIDYFKPDCIVSLPRSAKQIKEVKVTNEIGPNSKVSVILYQEMNGQRVTKVLAESKFKELSSLPSSPGSLRTSSAGSSVAEEDSTNDKRATDWDNLQLILGRNTEDQHPLPQMENQSDLHIPDAVHLYEDLTKHRVRIEIKGFDPLEVFVGTRSQNRLFQLSPFTTECRYHILVIVEISKNGILVVVRSPLQVLNDLPLPVNICFKKSALLNLQTDLNNRACSPSLSLASLGSTTSNPFEEYPSLITLQPDEIYSLPLFVAYHSPLYVVPSAIDFGVSESGIWWKEMQSSPGPRVISCLPKPGTGCPVSIGCSLTEGVRLSSSLQDEISPGNVPNYLLRLTSPIIIHNYLPFTLVLHHRALPLPLTLDPGACTSVIRMDPHEDEELDLQICNYQGSDWKGVLCIPVERSEASRTLTLTRVEGTIKGKLEVSLYLSRDTTTDVYVYAPYWVVNKTGLPLQVRGSRSKFVSEGSGGEEILLFRYKKNHPHKLKVKVLESEWSRGWSCDAVGTCGVVICEDKLRNKKFRILSKITQSILKASLPSEGRKGMPKAILHLTKIVTLMPYFLVRNTTARALMYMQESDKNGLWFDIGSNQCEAFWPNSDDMYLVVRKRETQVISQRFHFNSVHKTVLRMEKGRALVVSVDGVGSDQPVTITFSKYRTGDAPVRLENWCDDIFLRFHQRGSNQVTLLAPRQSVLYTWDDPTLQRDLLWNIYNRKSEDFPAVINMDKDGTEKVTVTTVKQGAVRAQSQSCTGTPKVRPKKPALRQRARTTPSTSSSDEEELPDGWLLVGKDQYKMKQGLSPSKGHLRGMQKDKMLVHWICHRQGRQRVLLFTQSDRLACLTRLPNERALIEMILSVNQIGISVINKNGQEVLYGGIFPSVPTWQLEVDGVWKVPPSMELCSWLEDQYLHNKDSHVNLKGAMQVDLERMRMNAPFSGRLRRIKHPALWIHYRHSAHYAYCRARVTSIQVDNQAADAIFPTVLSSNRDRIYEKPSIDFCLMTHCGDRQTHKTIRHLSVISQDFVLNIDKGFVVSVYDWILPSIIRLTKDNIHSELKNLLTPLTFSSIQKVDRAEECVALERFCLAGLHIDVSYSPKGIPSSEKVPDALEGVLASLGVSLGEVKNTGINVSQLEIEATTWDRMIKDLKNHVRNQLLQQIFVLILGLDILGNPYQRLKDLTQGVRDLVYDTTSGTIQRPDEYGDEISDESYSLCGHVTGGDDIHSFRMFGSLIDCDISSLAIKDRNMRNTPSSAYSESPPDELSEGIDGSVPSRWLSPAGLVWSFTGMVIDPLSASQQESVECLLRGKWRGLLGLITNASFGVRNPVTMVQDGLRRAQIHGFDASFRLRPPRHSSSFSPLKPVCHYETEGLALLASVPQRFLIHSDKYFGHVYLTETKHPPIFLSTVRHFYFMEPYGNWGRCEVVWRIAVQHLAKQPMRNNDTITFQLRQDESQSHLSGAVRLIQCGDAKILDSVMSLVTSLMTLHMENLPCPAAS